VQQKNVRDIVIVGGGTAGWMTAAALSKVLKNSCTIRLIESDEIATIGVGEATIPPITAFNDALGIDENELLKATQGTFKLGIEFVNWGRLGDSYIHAFGRYPSGLPTGAFHAYWQKLSGLGRARDLANYSINSVAARAAKMLRPVSDMPGSPLGDIATAFHFDASLYARFLRRFSEKLGVIRIEGKITGAVLREPDGFIDCVVMDGGEKIAGDFFIDCSGMRGLLIEQFLHTGFEDWSAWLPCDRAIAVPCESGGQFQPLTRSTAHTAGWQWRIPLQHRIGNGHVYSSKYMGDEDALSVLLANLDGKALADPRYIRYVPGKRKKVWNKNCLSIGLSSGFLEPLESTSIHLIQTAISRLMKIFPDRRFNQVEIDAFNAESDLEYQQIRDFLILHYKLNQRDDSPFWNYCRNMQIPETLQHKISLYASSGRILPKDKELFDVKSWLEVMHGQGLRATGYDPLVDVSDTQEIADTFTNIHSVIEKCVSIMPSHAEFVAKNCASIPLKSPV
jgi:tryptophan halogenase